MTTVTIEPSLEEELEYGDQLKALVDDLRSQGMDVRWARTMHHSPEREAFDLVIEILAGAASLMAIVQTIGQHLRGKIGAGSRKGQTRFVKIVDQTGRALKIVPVASDDCPAESADAKDR